MTADQLVKKCKQGDRTAFKELVNTYSSTLMAIALRYMKDQSLAQDVLQESFIKVFRKIESYAGNGSFEGWLKRITVNTCLEQIRKHNKRVLYIDNYEEMNCQSVGPSVLEQMKEEDIIQIINQLPEHYRIIFNLAIVEGYSHREIGEMLGISESTSRTKLSRARTMVKDFFLNNKDNDEFRSARKAY